MKVYGYRLRLLGIELLTTALLYPMMLNLMRRLSHLSINLLAQFYGEVSVRGGNVHKSLRIYFAQSNIYVEQINPCLLAPVGE